MLGFCVPLELAFLQIIANLKPPIFKHKNRWCRRIMDFCYTEEPDPVNQQELFGEGGERGILGRPIHSEPQAECRGGNPT